MRIRIASRTVGPGALRLGTGSRSACGGVVDGQEQAVERSGGQRGEVGGAREEAAQPPDCVLHAALLPGRVRSAAEGLDAERVQFAVADELGTVVEADAAAQGGGQGGEQGGQGTDHQ